MTTLLQGRYRLIRRLAGGKLSQTFLAIDHATEPATPCVIKECAAASHLRPQQRDIQPFRQLQHGQIPDLLDWFEQENCCYWVHEYLAGDNLARVLQAEGQFSATEVWALLRELLPVLQFIHNQNIVHRDIKPENILRQVTATGQRQLVLVDFSSAQQVGPSSDFQPGTAIGSPIYAAPEQLRGQSVFASDLYSLGVTCLHLLTGVHPFQLFDAANHCWVWRDYWVAEEEHSLLADLLDRLVEPALAQRLPTAVAAIDYGWSDFRGMASPPAAQSCPPQSLPGWQCSAILTGHEGLFASVNGVAISPAGHLLASASDDQTVRLWDINTAAVIRVLAGHQRGVKTVAFQAGADLLLASGGDDRLIHLWEPESGNLVHSLRGHQHAINALCFSPDHQLLASGSADKTIKLWHPGKGEWIADLIGHTLAVKTLAFAPSQPWLASGSSDRSVKIWDLARLKVLHTLADHTWSVTAIAFSPDGQFLATGSEDRTIQLWECKSWQKVRTLSGHGWPITSLAFTPDGNWLLSGSWDKTIKVWQVSTGEELARLTGHRDAINAVALAPKGETIASASADQTLRLWQQTPPQERLGELQGRRGIKS
uniref:Serine/threonine protein kinase with WD40 repeats n=1 Tax=Cyanothece sp. (strain PCC 7425 / ATCC 29141) TaxID=395961 RepID=B8HUE8_CYAP4